MFPGLMRVLRVGVGVFLNVAVTLCVIVATLAVGLAFLIIPYSFYPHRKPSVGFGLPHAHANKHSDTSR